MPYLKGFDTKLLNNLFKFILANNIFFQCFGFFFKLMFLSRMKMLIIFHPFWFLTLMHNILLFLFSFVFMFCDQFLWCFNSSLQILKCNAWKICDVTMSDLFKLMILSEMCFLNKLISYFNVLTIIPPKIYIHNISFFHLHVLHNIPFFTKLWGCIIDQIKCVKLW
jgi:hypothetical protein